MARLLTKLGSGNTPCRRQHVQFVNGGWPGHRNLLFPFLWVWIFSCPVVWTSLGVCFFLQNLQNSQKSTISRVLVCCSGTGCKLVVGQWENFILCSLFCIFIIIIIIIISHIHSHSHSTSTSISFVVLLNCLYLNLWVLPFVHLSSLSCWWVGEEGWASGCLVLNCWLLG